MCGISFGKAFLLNAILRFWRQASDQGQSLNASKIEKAWKQATSQSFQQNYLLFSMGAMATRGFIRQQIETCVICLKEIAELAIRENLLHPATLVCGPLRRVVLGLDDRRLFEPSLTVLQFITAIEPPAKCSNLFIEWCNNKIFLFQFMRLLEMVQECLDGLEEPKLSDFIFVHKTALNFSFVFGYRPNPGRIFLTGLPAKNVVFS